MAINREILGITGYSFLQGKPLLIEAKVRSGNGGDSELVTCFIPGGFDGFCAEGMVFVFKGSRRVVPDKIFTDPNALKEHAYLVPSKLSKTLKAMFRRS